MGKKKQDKRYQKWLAGQERTRIESCPFCGKEADLDDWPYDSKVGTMRIECEQCGARGPLVIGFTDKSRNKARKLWNKAKR